MRARATANIVLGSLLFLGAAGCVGYEGAPLSNPPEPPNAANGGLPPAAPKPVSDVDVLFVIDNSGSMASEQQKLAREITRIVNVLTSGDRYADREDQVPANMTEKSRRFAPVRSLHVGVVSTNMGGLDAPPGTQVAVRSCAGLGDDGVLQFDTTVAQTGVIANGKEFLDYERGEVVIAADPSCALPPQPDYQSYDGTGDPVALGHAFACVARLGVRGCPFEQPLEAMWKALAPRGPSNSSDAVQQLYTFANGTAGQGELANSGFLREEAVLAVVHLTDEDDCSVTDAGKALFGVTADDEKYGPLNLRCGALANDESLVRSTDRYVNGLRSLKPGHQERVVFAAVAGFPAAAIASGASYDELLAHPDMQHSEDPLVRGFPRPACSVPSDGKPNVAYPARRLAQLAKTLGSQAVLESICAESYGPVLDHVIEKVASQLGAR